MRGEIHGEALVERVEELNRLVAEYRHEYDTASSAERPVLLLKKERAEDELAELLARGYDEEETLDNWRLPFMWLNRVELGRAIAQEFKNLGGQQSSLRLLVVIESGAGDDLTHCETVLKDMVLGEALQKAHCGIEGLVLQPRFKSRESVLNERPIELPESQAPVPGVLLHTPVERRRIDDAFVRGLRISMENLEKQHGNRTHVVYAVFSDSTGHLWLPNRWRQALDRHFPVTDSRIRRLTVQLRHGNVDHAREWIDEPRIKRYALLKGIPEARYKPVVKDLLRFQHDLIDGMEKAFPRRKPRVPIHDLSNKLLQLAHRLKILADPGASG